MLDAHVIKRRPDFAVDVSLTVQPGERLALFGPSAAGKSTVLSCVAGIETPDSGYIRFNGTEFFPGPLPLHERTIAYLTQKDWLFPHLTVEENVKFALRYVALADAQSWIAELRDRLSLGPIWHHRARRVSGGQARRVALARMLARRPPLVLLDEPFVALDRPTIDDLVLALLEWQSRVGFMLLVVDHRFEVLQKLCPRVAAIENGRVVQVGHWQELIETPATDCLRRLLH